MRCRDAVVRTTAGKPLGQKRHMRRSRPRRWSACMAREEDRVLLGRVLREWAHELAPMQSPPRKLHFDRAILHTEKALRLGTMLLRSAYRIRKSQADTWTVISGRYIRFYDKQNKVRFHTFTYKLTHLRRFSYTFLWTLIFRCSATRSVWCFLPNSWLDRRSANSYEGAICLSVLGVHGGGRRTLEQKRRGSWSTVRRYARKWSKSTGRNRNF